METRDYARSLIDAETLAGKLRRPAAALDDTSPGPPLRLSQPRRPANLKIVAARHAKVPSAEGMADLAQRIRIVHASANHELQAVELFAWALLAFPEAPAAMRRGMLRILADEQQHCELCIARLAEWGIGFGDFPVSGYFWNKTDQLSTPLAFVCTMGLTFESANLDHAIDYATLAEQHGDPITGALFRKIHADEIRHVRFGWHWLARLKPPDQPMWEAYREALTYPVRPELARGRVFHAASRREAGLDADFITGLAGDPDTPGPRSSEP